MTTSYSPHKKMETQKQEISHFPIMTLPHNAPTTNHQTHSSTPHSYSGSQLFLTTASLSKPPTSRYTMPPCSMPIKHSVTYQAFRKITNFIRDNGEFCTNMNTAQAIKKAATKTKTPKERTKQKIAKMNGCLAPKLLLQSPAGNNGGRNGIPCCRRRPIRYE